MPTLYITDKVTGEWIGQRAAQTCPRTGQPLLHPDSVQEPPPQLEAQQAAVWKDSKWTVVPDYRNEDWYAVADGSPIDIELGWEPDPTQHTQKPYPGDDYQWDATKGDWVLVEDAAWLRLRNERDYRLAASDWVLLRHRDELDAGITTTLTTAQIQNWLSYRQQLRELPATITNPVDWLASPTWPTKPTTSG